MTFRDENKALQVLAREVAIVRAHNTRHDEGYGDQPHVLLFAEGALYCMALEHFVRVVVAHCCPDAPSGMQLRNLLEYATSPRRTLINLPWDDQADGVEKVTSVRNALLHGNFAQAAEEAGCASVEDYFKNQYAGEVEAMFRILDHVMKQIDPETGRPRAPSAP